MSDDFWEGWSARSSLTCEYTDTIARLTSRLAEVEKERDELRERLFTPPQTMRDCTIDELIEQLGEEHMAIRQIKALRSIVTDKFGLSDREMAALGSTALHAENAQLETALASSRALVAKWREALESMDESAAVQGTGEYEQGLLCGVEDRGLQKDGYGAMRYGYDRALERVNEHLAGLVDLTPADCAGTLVDAAELSFADAVKIATGCLDYGGGHHTDGHLDAFHHGIKTVINALEGAQKNGLKDTQVAALHRMGDAARAGKAAT